MIFLLAANKIINVLYSHNKPYCAGLIKCPLVLKVPSTSGKYGLQLQADDH